VLASALADLALRGCLVIEQDNGRTTLRRVWPRPQAEGTAPAGKPDPFALQFTDQLFGREERLRVDPGNAVAFSRAANALRRSLDQEFSGQFGRKNARRLIPSLFLCLGLAAMLAFQAQDPAQAAALAVLGLFWTLACGLLGEGALRAWRQSRTKGAALFLALLPFGLGDAAALAYFGTRTSLLSGLFLAAGAVALTSLALKLKTPTPAGQALQARLSTLREEMAGRAPDPGPDERQFEARYAQALALDVEEPWCARFLARLEREGKEYRPAWFESQGLDRKDRVRALMRLGRELDRALERTLSPHPPHQDGREDPGNLAG
jgi:hypothetical protein